MPTAPAKSGTMKIRNAVDARRFLMIFDKIEQPFTVAWTHGEKRTKAQNRTIHKWFDEISAHLGDTPADHVKAECNLMFGRPIMARDFPEWEAAFGYVFDSLNLPSKLKAIRVLDIPFTRKMTTPQLSEYMDAMRRHYDEIGIRLTDPGAAMYEGEME